MLQKTKKDKKRFAAVCVAALVAVLLAVVGCSILFRKNGVEGEKRYPLEVSFVDVEQGDGIVVRCGETTLVIDGGETYLDDRITGFLKDAGVSEIDCYIASHPHADHIGAAARILDEFPVKSVMTTAFSELNVPTTLEYERFAQAVEKENCEVIFAAANESYTFGELTLDVLSPEEETGDYNNMSLVIRMSFRDNTFLFTGDAEAEIEQALTDRGALLSAQVLKVGHHGSDSSTGDGFVSAVSPRIAVISCGKDNDYGHPARQTLDTLEKHGVAVYRTDQLGTVTVYGDGKDVFVS